MRTVLGFPSFEDRGSGQMPRNASRPEKLLKQGREQMYL